MVKVNQPKCKYLSLTQWFYCSPIYDELLNRQAWIMKIPGNIQGTPTKPTQNWFPADKSIKYEET